MPLGAALLKLKSLVTGDGKLVKSVTDGLDELFTSKEEKAVLDNKRAEIEAMVMEKTNSHIEKMSEIELETLRAQFADTSNAREMNMRIQESDKTSWLTKNITALLTIVVTIGFFSLLGYMLKYEVPKSNERIMDILLGSLGTAWITIVGYYFGSSVGSKNNGDLVRKMAINK